MDENALAGWDDDQLAALATLAQDLDAESAAALAELGQARAEGQISRRDAIKAGAALGVGGLLGGAGVGSAAASANDNDSDPQVGTQSTPADVYADGITANEVSTDRADITERWDFKTGYRSAYQNVTQDGTTYHSEPNLIRVGNELIYIYRSGSGHAENSGKLVLRRSTDYGDTWSSESTIFDTTHDTRNQCVHVLDSGRIVILFRDTDYSGSASDTLYASYSDDAGQTWASLNNITSLVNESGQKVPWRGGMVETTNGLMAGTNLSSGLVEAFFSTDNGETWGSRTTVIDNSKFTDGHTEANPLIPVPADRSEVLLFGRRTGSGGFWAAKSFDGGSSWNSPVYFDPAGSAPSTAPYAERVTPQSLIFLWGDRGDGRLYYITASTRLAWQDPTVLASHDPASLAVRDATDSLDFGYPWALSLGPSAGDTMVSWYDGDGGDDPDIHQLSGIEGVIPATAGSTSGSVGGTYVEAYRSSSVSGISAGTATNVVDTELEDALGEFDSNQEFSPSETGIYQLNAFARIDPNSDGDTLFLKLQNITDNNAVITNARDAIGSGKQTMFLQWQGQLDSSKSYELQFFDNTGSFGIDSGTSKTYMTISSGTVQV